MARAFGRAGNSQDLNEAIRDNLFTEIDLNTAIRVEQGEVQLVNNSVADTDLRNVRVGTGSVSFSGGQYTVSTGANSGDAQALETARLAEYKAGIPGVVGVLIQKDSDPTGFAEWGYGGDAFGDELLWRLESDGTYRFDRIRGGTRTQIPRSAWEKSPTPTTVQDANGDDVGDVVGKDALDGTGPSGADISTPVLGLFGIDFVLYGGGGVAPWFVDLNGEGVVEKLYPFVFRPRNETILTQFSQPIVARIDNDGTATADDLAVAERQFSTFGSSSTEARDTPHLFDLGTSISAQSPTALFGIRRADPGGGIPISLAGLSLQTDYDGHLFYLVNPTISSGGGDANWVRPSKDFAGNQVSASETGIEVNESLSVDATTGISIDAGLVSSAQQTKVEANITRPDNSVFIRDRPVVLMAEGQANESGSDTEGRQLVTERF